MDNYRFGKRQVSHRKRRIVITIIILALLGGAGIAVEHYLKSIGTVINTPPAPVVTSVLDKNAATKRFDEGTFTISLPSDWQFVSHQTAGYNMYTWENTKNVIKGMRQLSVYADAIPATLGVNRVLPVQADGDHVIPTSVSDNCADFTGDKVPGSPHTPAKWQNTDFLCDLGNYERDVVGTSTQGSINEVTLTGKTTGTHRFFFTFTDNSPTPAFDIFTNALQSFKLK